MGIIYDYNKGKLSQNAFQLSDRVKEYEEFVKSIGGEIIKLESSGQQTINPLDPVFVVTGNGKNEFIKKLSNIMIVTIVENKEDYVTMRVSKSDIILVDEKEKTELLALLNEFSCSVHIQRAN